MHSGFEFLQEPLVPDEIKAKNLSVNLNEVVSKPAIWTSVRLQSNDAYCGLCEIWYNLEGDPGDIVNHESVRRRETELKTLDEQRQQEELENLREEAIEQKMKEILETIEDHPKFLRFSWLPHYHILQIFKVDTKFPWGTSDEFLVSADTDQSELMLEILEYLDAK